MPQFEVLLETTHLGGDRSGQFGCGVISGWQVLFVEQFAGLVTRPRNPASCQTPCVLVDSVARRKFPPGANREARLLVKVVIGIHKVFDYKAFLARKANA